MYENFFERREVPPPKPENHKGVITVNVEDRGAGFYIGVRMEGEFCQQSCVAAAASFTSDLAKEAKIPIEVMISAIIAEYRK